MRWNRISVLIDKIQEELIYQGLVAMLKNIIRFVTFLQVLSSGSESTYSCSFAARNCPNELYGQPRPNECCASRFSKVDLKPSAANIGHFTARRIHRRLQSFK